LTTRQPLTSRHSFARGHAFASRRFNGQPPIVRSAFPLNFEADFFLRMRRVYFQPSSTPNGGGSERFALTDIISELRTIANRSALRSTARKQSHAYQSISTVTDPEQLDAFLQDPLWAAGYHDYPSE